MRLTLKTIPGYWQLQNPWLAAVNRQLVSFEVTGARVGTFSQAIFYCHGLGGSPADCPEIDTLAQPNCPVIRVDAFGLKEPLTPLHLPFVTFGDVCSLLHNSRQAILALATELRLSHYAVIGHSWGGFMALLAGLADQRCRHVVMLASSPDICDAMLRLPDLLGLPEMARHLTPSIAWDAEAAKSGRGLHQDAWSRLNPYQPSPNPDVKLLIVNRCDDPVMRRSGVEHFIEFAQSVPIAQVEAHFLEDTDPNRHDMPYRLFAPLVQRFLADCYGPTAA